MSISKGLPSVDALARKHTIKGPREVGGHSDCKDKVNRNKYESYRTDRLHALLRCKCLLANGCANRFKYFKKAAYMLAIVCVELILPVN